MSRVGKVPMKLGDEVKLKTINGSLEMSRGNITVTSVVDPAISYKLIDDGRKIQLLLNGKEENNRLRSIYGTQRSLINSTIVGLNSGHEITLDLVGVGYKASIEGKKITLSLGYSHDIIYVLPSKVEARIEKSSSIILQSFEKKVVGFAAAEISKFRPHEPYKGKGIKKKGVLYVRKEGKKK